MKISLNGNEFTAYDTPCADVCVFETEQDSVRVSIDDKYKVTSVRPLGLNVSACNQFTVGTGKKAIVEFENHKPLFIFTYTKETVDKDDYTYYFEKGVHNVPDIVLNSGESIYLESGCVLKTHIFADDAENIRICGRGIIDTTEIGAKKHRMIKLIECNNLSVCDVTLIGAIDWSLVPIHCENVTVNSVNIVTWEVNGDGVDIVGCKNVSVKNCFMHCADDCVAIKANDYDDDRGCNNCDNITIEKCIFWNTRPGNAMEIGFETRCDEISNVAFCDCDVIHCEYEGYESGGVFTIHNGDRALIHNVKYENIRVENAKQKLFDFKVLLSRYSKDNERGLIRDIVAENIRVYGDDLPPSILRGTDNSHGVKNVCINGLYHNDIAKNSLLAAHIITESGSEVVFASID